MDRNIIVVELEDLLATITAATARTMKLYGQMIPNTKSGGCHDGALRVRRAREGGGSLL